jgi:hypothetical protein
VADLHRIDLPGLAGDVMLGFLAVRGLMGELLEVSYLCWDPEDRHAILYCRTPASIADLVSVLVKRLQGTGGYRSRAGAGSGWLLDAGIAGGPGLLELYPERLFTEALAGRRRDEGSEGRPLDHRAVGPADPGASWLATLAAGDFRYPGYGRRQLPQDPPSGWFRVEGVDVFAWPLWTLPVSRNTLEAVWNVGWRNGDWKFARASGRGLVATISKTHGVPAPNAIDYNRDLGIFTMCAAARPRGGGPLIPVPVQVKRIPSSWKEYPAWEGWDWDVPDPGEYPGKYGWG